MENTEADNNESELENEAHIALEKIVNNRKIADDDDDDEFAEAFEENAAANIKNISSNERLESKTKPKKQDNVPPTAATSTATTDNVVAEKQMRSKDGEGLTRELPPLPEFALELITRQKSNADQQATNVISPTISIRSYESSEHGWSSDSSPFKIKPQQSLEEAEKEWSQVETVTADSKSGLPKSPTVNFTEAIFHFRSANLDEYSASIKPTIKHSGFSAIWHALAGPPKMHPRLRQDRDLIFTLGLCPFDNLEAMHIMILQTIYKKLTATNLDCPRYGNHWESIGFQGVDPSTDLRGCGMLGLLTTLHLVSNKDTHNLAIDIYRLSEDEIQNFPFCVMAINITRITLQIFREERLNKECNKRGQVFEVFNELFCSIYYQIYRTWKLGHKTIKDSGFVIEEVETAARKDPCLLIKSFQKAMNERKKTKVPVDNSSTEKQRNTGIERVDKFAGVCDIQSEEEEVHLV
eukprot:gene18261-20081_t